MLHRKCGYGSHSNRDILHWRIWSSRLPYKLRRSTIHRCRLHQPRQQPKALVLFSSRSTPHHRKLGLQCVRICGEYPIHTGGVAPTGWNYQLNVCDQSWMWVEADDDWIYIDCYKQCWSWCGDTSSPYFRTDGDDGGAYNGVSFNQNGHTNVSYKTMSVGIR